MSPVRKRLAVLAVLAAALALPAVASAAQDAFMVIPGVKSESTDPRYTNSIELRSWNWDLKVAPGTGKPAFGGFEFSKLVDSSSPFLFTHAGSGAQIPSIRVIVRKAGTKPLAYLQYCLEDSRVTSYAVSSGDEAPEENVTLDPGALAMRYVRQKVDGTGLPPVFGGWSVVSQTSIGFDAQCGGTGST